MIVTKTKYHWAEVLDDAQGTRFWLGKGYVNLDQDVTMFKTRLSDQEQKFIYNIFSFFVEADIIVAGAYGSHYAGAIEDPGIDQMLATFNGVESQHIKAYNALLDTLGFPEERKSEYSESEAVEKKVALSKSFDSSTPYGKLLAIAGNGPFGEGLQLFGSFAMLMVPFMDGTMLGMTTIVTLSMRDELIHTHGITKLYETFRDKLAAEGIDLSNLDKDIQDIARRTVDVEIEFIEFSFQNYSIRNVNKEEIISYIKYLADVRLKSLDVEPIYNEPEGRIAILMDDKVEGRSLAKFFEAKSSEYLSSDSSGYTNDLFEKCADNFSNYGYLKDRDI